jgi:hypothetical protein
VSKKFAAAGKSKAKSVVRVPPPEPKPVDIRSDYTRISDDYTATLITVEVVVRTAAMDSEQELLRDIEAGIEDYLETDRTVRVVSVEGLTDSFDGASEILMDRAYRT